MSLALFDERPGLEQRLPRAALGEFPTPVQPLPSPVLALGAAPSELWVKRDDVSSSLYGGNKVRTLELLFGHALSLGRARVMATGPFGSNHALASALHAPRVGLEPEALLFPQPISQAAFSNFRALTESAATLHALPHWSALPFGMAWFARAAHARYIMPPGGATALGALGYVSAGLELAKQIANHELPAPRRVIVGVGSTCTAAGLLLGLRLAAHFGRAFAPSEPPTLIAVRVSPWPVTSRLRILHLAVRAARLLHQKTDGKWPAFASAELGRHFRVDGGYLGPGYGFPSAAGNEAEALWQRLGLPALDSTYSAKVAARVLSGLRAREPGPTLYWATKSSLPLPAPVPALRERPVPALMRAWLERGARTLPKNS